LVLSEGRLEARLIASGEGTVTLGAKLGFKGAVTSSHHAEPTDPQAYLKPREGLIVITDRIKTLARTLAGQGTDAASAVLAYWNYMIDNLICGAIHYDQIRADAPCDSVLEMGWYDCQLGSALFVALCRSTGIAARLVGGHVLYRPAPTNHYWSEVWFEKEGWRPFDFLSWDLSLGGRDPDWRNYFHGRIDNRMVTQLLPFKFTGALGLAMPEIWHIVQTAKENGVEIGIEDMTGEPTYTDFVSVDYLS
jgi:hypothetical protein